MTWKFRKVSPLPGYRFGKHLHVAKVLKGCVLVFFLLIPGWQRAVGGRLAFQKCSQAGPVRGWGDRTLQGVGRCGLGEAAVLWRPGAALLWLGVPALWPVCTSEQLLSSVSTVKCVPSCSQLAPDEWDEYR